MEVGNKKAFQIFFICSSIFVMLISFNHCGKTTTKLPVVSSNEGLANINGSGGTPPAIVSEVVHVGVKNFEEINDTMSYLTTVPKSSQNNNFNAVKLSLPGTHSIKSFQTVNQLAIVKLASYYCSSLINSYTYRTAVWGSFNFNSTAINAFQSANRTIFITEMIKRFWSLHSGEIANYSSEIQEISDLIDDLADGMNMNSSTTTRNVAKGACTAVLSSAKITIL